jgi:hypothetical protein
MTDRTQFEQMLEALINEDQQQAKEIFHNIVVAKSREIYEELLESDFGAEEKPADDSSEADDDFASDDATDDFNSDVEADDDTDSEADDMDGEGDVEDRVQDLEDALEDLKAEFEQLMAGEEGEEMPADDMGMDDMGMDDMGDDMGGDEFGAEEPEVAEAPVVQVQHSFMEDDEQLIREYVEKVGGATYDKFGKMGDNGTNTKSIVASKNDMGGTVANIANGHVEVSSDIGAKTTVQGSALSSNKPKDMNTGNINVPGGKAGNAFSKKEPGHGAEKKGTAPDQDKGAQSPISGLKSRAK